jgi:dTMP kinase
VSLPEEAVIIAIEGPDGSGKSTVARRVVETLGLALQVFPDRSTPVGRLIDLHLKGERWWVGLKEAPQGAVSAAEIHEDALVFQALMTINRLEVGGLLSIAEKHRLDLVCDRYWQSGYVYGAADGLDPEWLINIHALLPQTVLNILIDVPVEISQARLRARGMPDRYDKREPDFLDKIVTGYRALWQSHGSIGNWVVIDGSAPLEDVVLITTNIVRNWIGGVQGNP